MNEYIGYSNPDHLFDALDKIQEGVTLVDLNNPEEGEELPLITAFKNNKYFSLVKDLVEVGGADINKQDRDGHSPLYHLLNNYHPDNTHKSSLIEYLMNKGATLTEKDMTSVEIESDIPLIMDYMEKAENQGTDPKVSAAPEINRTPLMHLPSTIEQALKSVLDLDLVSGKALVPNTNLILNATYNENNGLATLVIEPYNKGYITYDEAH